jgi:hypothetical protein
MMRRRVSLTRREIHIRMEPTRLTSRGRRRLIAAASLAGTASVILALPSLGSAATFSSHVMRASQIRKVSRQAPNRRTLSPAARTIQRQGYLVPNQAAYERQKARASRRAAASSALTQPAAPFGPNAPSTIRAFAGINDTFFSPPDETSAVGTGRYIQLVNADFAIYSKTGNTPIGTGSLNSLVGAGSNDFVFDPQIIWDPTTKRFYYAAVDEVSAATHILAFGWSKTATPTSSADWCKFGVGSGATLPDFPKLGDSQHFGIIGTNLFSSGGGFANSNILAFKKPPAGTSCPSPSTANKGIATSAFTPTPANEIDTNGTGWVVARGRPTPSTKLFLFKVTRNASGNPVINTTPTSVTVPSYNAPANAPQQGSTNRIDTSDARNTQAVAANDPGHGGKFALWTQHTVSGGAGAEVRWYEIDVANHSVIQKGKATNASLFEFNGAIAPNRRVNGTTKSGGNAMVMNFNTSSSAAKPGIRMVSKVGGGAQSGQVAVKSSPGQLSGFDCDASSHLCRWGDYAAVTPDPSTANRMWNVSQFAVGSGSGTSGPATSRTWHFVVQP